MKSNVEALSEYLAIGLKAVARVCPAKAPLPILANALIRDDNGRLRLTGGDLTTVVEAHVGAMVDAPISVCVPAAALLKMLKPMDGKLSLTQDGKTLIITDDRRTVRLAGADPEDYPPTPAPKGDTASFRVHSHDLALALARILFTAAKDDSRPVLQAVNFEAASDGGLTLAAVDGFRLSVARMRTVDPPSKDASANIPAPSLAELARLLPKDGEEVAVTLAENVARFEVSHYTVTAMRIQGTFPNYHQIIPTDYTGRATFIVADMLAEARTLAAFARDGSGIVRLAVEGDLIRMSAKVEETGSYETTLPAAVEGDAIKVALNGAYLVDALQHLGAERAILSVLSPSAPVLFEPVGGEYQHTVMPMTVSW